MHLFGTDDQSFVRDAIPADFERLRKYTQYIKAVNNEHWYAYVTPKNKFDSAAWTVLGQHLGPRDFPQLTCLIICECVPRHPMKPFHQPQFHHFINASLRTLEFHISFKADSRADRYNEDDIVDLEDMPEECHHARLDYVHTLLRHAATHCPGIRKLAVDVEERSESMTEAISDAICSFGDLVECFIFRETLRPSAFRHLAWLPTLFELMAGMNPQEYPQGLGVELGTRNDASNTSGLKPFAALKYLNIRADTSFMCTDFLQHVRSPRIHELSVRINGPVGDDVNEFLAALCSHPSATSLAFRRLALWLGGSNQAKKARCFSYKLLLSLSGPSFSKLRHITICGFSYAGLDDTVLEAMARAWPHARVVELLPYEPIADECSNTKMVRGSLVAFSYFAEHCPNITQLSFALEDVTREAIHAAYKTCANRFQSSFSRFVYINVGPSSVSGHDIDMIAALLSMWFVDLDIFPYHSPYAADFWDKVSIRVRPFRRVRKMERRWIRDSQNESLRQPSLE